MIGKFMGVILQIDVDHIFQYGIEEALLIGYLQHIIRDHVGKDKYFIDGRHWTYNTTEYFINKVYPFLTRRKFEYIVKSLIDQNVIVTANFNKNKFDKTKWYAFVDEEKFLAELDARYHRTPKNPSKKSSMHKNVQCTESKFSEEKSPKSGSNTLCTKMCITTHKNVHSYIDPLTNTLTNFREGVLENAPHSQEEVVSEKRKKGTRLDSTWKLPSEYREWAISQGLFDEQLDRIADNFRDHWISTTKNAIKLCWFATWRKWIRSECERRNIPPPKTISKVTEKVEVEIPSRTSNDPRIQRWYDMAPEFKAAAESKYGLGSYTSWLGPIECQKITDDHVILMAPTRFIADRITCYREIFYEFMRKIVPTLGDGMNHPENCIEITYTEHNNASS